MSCASAPAASSLRRRRARRPHGDAAAAEVRGEAGAEVADDVGIRVEQVDLGPDAPHLALEPPCLPAEPAAAHLDLEHRHELVLHAELGVDEEERGGGPER